MYINAAENVTLEMQRWSFDGNQPSLVILGKGVTTIDCYFSAENVVVVSLADSVSMKRTGIFSNKGSTFYCKSYGTNDYSNDSKVTINYISSGDATNYGACGIDCSVTLASDNSIVAVSTPVHTWGEGTINVEYCPIGSVSDFECNYCAATKTEGEGVEHDHTLSVIIYENGFMNKGIKAIKCSNSECSSKLEETEEALPIFLFRGYSYSLTGTGSFISSFAVNHKALNEYNEASENKIESYGVFAVGASNVKDNDPFAEGTKCARVEYFGKKYDIFEMKLSGLAENNDVPLYCTAYVTVGGKNLFVDNGELKDTLENALTFDEVIEIVDK